MAKQAHERLADALDAVSRVAVENIVQSRLINENQVTLLKREGFLKPIIRGWYLLDADLGESETGASVLWQESYWQFVSQYLQTILGEAYIVSAEQSLDIHTGINCFPTQLLIGNTAKINRVVSLPNGLSVSLFTASQLPDVSEVFEGVCIYPVEAALIKAGPAYFRKQPKEVALALTLASHAKILNGLLEGANAAAAGRLAGAYRAVNKPQEADEILSALKTAGIAIVEVNPFDAPVPDITLFRPQSPHAARIRLLWESLSEQVTSRLDQPVSPPDDIEKVIEQVEETYTHDAYHSLSIEGYRVTPALIERVRSGLWNPEGDEADKKQRDALAARGYWEAHNRVIDVIRRLHVQTLSPAEMRGEVSEWYRELFAPMARVGMLRPADLAGYRNRMVFIKNSRHIPLPVESVTDAMETLFECIQKESHPLTRAILSHWLIGYIHPFPDGNGRTARFLMNALLVTAGYHWTIIRLETRADYMAALEQLSVHQNAEPFVALIIEAMRYDWGKTR